MTKAKTTKPAVSWHMPDGKGGFKKRPFAYSTQAESDYLRALAATGHTFETALMECRYAPTERAICMAYVEAGYADVKMADCIR